MNLTSVQQPLIGNVTFAIVHNRSSSVETEFVPNQLYVDNNNISKINQTIELSERNNNSSDKVCTEKKNSKTAI